MKIILRLLSILAVMAALGGGNALAQEQNDRGALTPDEALSYMKSKNDLLIVDVAAERWYAEKHFAEAVNIPIESLYDAEEKKRYQNLPGGPSGAVALPFGYDRARRLPQPETVAAGYS